MKLNTFIKELGQLVDDGAPYSAIGFVELKLLSEQIGLPISSKLEKAPEGLEGYSHFQYGTFSHSSKPRKKLDSTTITVYSDGNRQVDTC